MEEKKKKSLFSKVTRSIAAPFKILSKQDNIDNFQTTESKLTPKFESRDNDVISGTFKVSSALKSVKKTVNDTFSKRDIDNSDISSHSNDEIIADSINYSKYIDDDEGHSSDNNSLKSFRNESQNDGPTSVQVYPILKNDLSLRRIGESMKAIQKDIDVMESKRQTQEIKTNTPKFKQEIKDIKEIIVKLKRRIEIETNEGVAHIQNLSSEILTHSAKIDQIKQNMYFPFSSFRHGSDGVYLSYNDIWLEKICGCLLVDCIPSKSIRGCLTEKAKFVMVLTGDNYNMIEKASYGYIHKDIKQEDSGMTIRLLLEDFNLKYESSKLPSLSLKELLLELTIKVTANMSYESSPENKSSSSKKSNGANNKQMLIGKWICDADNFHVEVLSFKGPFSLGQGTMSTLVSLITPQIRETIRGYVAPEIGEILSGSPMCSGSIGGTFQMTGTKLDLLSKPMVQSVQARQYLSCSGSQLSMFRYMQKSIDCPTRLKSLGDILRYVKNYSKHESWIDLCQLWQEAQETYIQKVIESFSNSPTAQQQHHVEVPSILPFQTLVDSVTEIERKHLKINMVLTQIDGQISLTKSLLAYHSYVKRSVEYEVFNQLSKGLIAQSSLHDYLQEHLKVLDREHLERECALKLLCCYVTTLALGVKFHFHSGEDIKVAIERLQLNLPVALLASFPFNPFSTSLQKFVNNTFFGVFHPTETEDLHVTRVDTDITDIKIVSSARTEDNDTAIPLTDKSPKVERRGSSAFATPLMSRTNTMSSCRQGSSDYTDVAKESQRKLERRGSSSFATPLRNRTNSMSSSRQGSLDYTDVAKESQYIGEKSIIFHGTFNKLDLGMVFSPEWGSNSKASASGSVSPGQQLFAIVLDDNFKPDSDDASLEKKDKQSNPYKLITSCTLTRPLLSSFVKLFPELTSTANSDSSLHAVLGGYPVSVSSNPQFRVGVDLKEANFVVNILSYLMFIDAYLSNTEELNKYVTLDEHAVIGARKALETFGKYFLMKGLNIDFALRVKTDVIPRSGSELHDSMLIITTSEKCSKIDNKDKSAAVKVDFDITLYDIIEDIMSVSNIVNNTTSIEEHLIV